MIETPDFLIIQFLRYKYNSKLQITEKDFKFIELPESLSIPNSNANYNLCGAIYHIGDSSNSGHYFSKHISNEGCIETYDDSRCYMNPIEKHLICNNAYLILYQKNEILEKENNSDHIDETIFDEIKICNFFKEYSDLTSIIVFNNIISAKDIDMFKCTFQLFCDELMIFNALDFERLYEFAASFINNGINSSKYLFKSILLAAHKKKRLLKNIEITIIVFLYKCVENDLITLNKITIN